MGKRLISYVSEEEYAREIELYKSINFPLDWRRVKCYDGYYEYNPKKKLLQMAVPTIKVDSPKCIPSFAEIIRKHHSRLPHIKWHIDSDFNAVLSDEELFKNAIPTLIEKLNDDGFIIETDITINTKNNKYSLNEWNNLIKKKISEQIENNKDTSIFTKEYVLNWNHIKCINGFYIFIPIINGFFVKTLIVKHNRCTKDFNRIISKYKDQLPQIHFRVNEKYEVELSDVQLLKTSLSNAKAQEEKEKKGEKENNKLVKRDEELRKKGIDPSLLLKTFTVNWEDMYFNKNYYTFNPNYNNSISKKHIERLHINDLRSRESFNFIIKYLMKRMPIIRYKITENLKIKLLDTPLLEVAINFLVKEQAKYDIGVGDIARATGHTMNVEKLTFKSAMSKAASMTLEDFKKYKSQFINYLILQQHKEHKVVPMSESITHRNITFEEATFIFTAKSWDNHLLLIIENVNPDRSTIIFKVNPSMYMADLQTVYDFMQSDIVNKRSSIREKSIDFSNCGIIEYWSCNHDSFNDWQNRIEKYIRH